jgi:hypothetical protein
LNLKHPETDLANQGGGKVVKVRGYQDFLMRSVIGKAVRKGRLFRFVAFGKDKF